MNILVNGGTTRLLLILKCWLTLKLFENFKVEEEKHCVWVQINSLNDLIKVIKSTNEPLIIEEFEKDGIPYLEGLIYDGWIE